MLVRVALPVPLYRVFDYRLAPGQVAVVGARVRVPFGRRALVGVVVALPEPGAAYAAREDLRVVSDVLDAVPLLSAALLRLLQWTADYYHYPFGEVIATALPGLLRGGAPALFPPVVFFQLTAAGLGADLAALRRAPRQQAVLQVLQQVPGGLAADDARLLALGNWRGAMQGLVQRGWVVRERRERTQDTSATRQDASATSATLPVLNADQAQAVATVQGQAGHRVYVLEGVTGSGKTEVYLSLMAATLAQERQCLVLVPEIALTPQLLARFRARLPVAMTVLHSGLSEKVRLQGWLAARSGQARVIIGTRSAVFVPWAQPGLIVVDEEHDASLKQHEGLRYHARDLAVLRGYREDVPVVLGSATPSLESLANVAKGAYQCVRLPRRAGGARLPSVRVVDMRRQWHDEGLSVSVLDAISAHLEAGGQVLLFLNRRGFAPALVCEGCGWSAQCPQCDAHLTWHQRAGLLCCHHCGTRSAPVRVCPGCQGRLRPRGEGTQRIEAALARHFPDAPLVRIDRDSTQGREAFEQVFAAIHAQQYRILIGTQMLAKGHDFPGVSLAVILGVDQGLFSTDFRAQERLAQVITQVAGRAGRAERPGEVLIQTFHPEHPFLRTLLQSGYAVVSQDLLEQRRLAGLPPFAAFALIRAEARDSALGEQFLAAVRAYLLPDAQGVAVLGPVPAPMQRRAGWFRAHLLLHAPSRSVLQRLLRARVCEFDALPLARQVRWSVDIDPVDMG
ncbi:primosomal protein N' [Thiorhodospira sibirica]|uniref:primosomal protein N' n=1 Tax=Thiorhodospira sibirica TaxID=154347 RepID=UPI000593FB6A|nr:primosomal protein N' [Thiorhodospira sibirica]